MLLINLSRHSGARDASGVQTLAPLVTSRFSPYVAARRMPCVRGRVGRAREYPPIFSSRYLTIALHAVILMLVPPSPEVPVFTLDWPIVVRN